MLKLILSYMKKFRVSAPPTTAKQNKAIAEKERQHFSKRELTEERICEINQILMMLRKGDQITVEYSCEYGQKHCVLSGNVEKVDLYWKSLQIQNVAISFSEIMDIYCVL